MRKEEKYPESRRVSMTRMEKSEHPHSWQRVDPLTKGKLGMARWTCAKCGAWIDAGAGTKPNCHLAPTCAQMTVDQVHDM